jgi:hypothetical protein
MSRNRRQQQKPQQQQGIQQEPLALADVAALMARRLATPASPPADVLAAFHALRLQVNAWPALVDCAAAILFDHYRGEDDLEELIRRAHRAAYAWASEYNL